MYKNIKRIFLLTTLLFIMMGVTAISAADSYDDTMDMQTDTPTIDNSQISTDTITNNNIVQDNNVKSNDDNKIQDNKKIIEKNTKKDANTINLNNDNIDSYFKMDDTYLSILDTIDSNTTFYIEEEITEPYCWSFNTEATGIILTASPDVTLTNQAFEINSIDFTMSNLSLVYDESFEYGKGIVVESEGFLMDNVNVDYDASIIDGELNTILLLKGSNSIITNSTFDCKIISTAIDWDPMSMSETAGMPVTVPITILADNVNITDNVITINEKGSDGSAYPSFYGIYLGGYYINFTRNNISLTGSNGYVYTVYVNSASKRLSSYVTISDNNITGISQHNYTAGVYIDGSSYQNITVVNNNITAISSKDYKDGMALQDVVYAVVITDYAYQGGTYRSGRGNVYNNSIINNTIIAEGHQVYGFEQFGGDNTLLSGNTIIVEGTCAQAIGAIGYNTIIEGNNLTAIGQTSGGESSPDYIPPTTAGVQVLHGSLTTVTNNNIDVTGARGILIQDSDNVITDNNITVTEYDYSIETLTNATGNLIENNLLITDAGNGSKTINNAAGENIIGNNSDEKELVETALDPDKLEGAIGEEIEIIVTIESDDGYGFDDEYIYIYANEEEILVIPIEDGFAFESYTIPESWYDNIELIARYPGSEDYLPSEEIIEFILDVPTTIETEDTIELDINDEPITLTATVIDMRNNTLDADIMVYENDQLQSTLADYTFTPTEVGTYSIKLVYEGELSEDGKKYMESEKLVTINVIKTITPVTVYLEFDEEYELGESIEINALINDLDDETVSGVNVDIYINEEYVTSVVSDDEGWIVYEFTPENVGNYTVVVRVNDEDYTADDAESTFEVIHTIVPVNLSLNVKPEAILGDIVDINGKVTDENGENVLDVNVDLYINDVFVNSIVSDENGNINYSFTPENLGNYTVTLKVNDFDYTADDAESKFEVLPNIKNVTMTIDVKKISYLGDNLTINAVVQYENKTAANDVNVDLYVDDELITSIISDAEGKIKYDYTPLTEGEHVIKLCVNDEHYVADNVTATVNIVELKGLNLKVETTEFTIGTNATIQATIYNGREVADYINKGKIAFKVNGKTLKDANGKVIYAAVTNGTATIENYEIPESWDKDGITIEAVYSGSNQCDALRSNKEELTINKETTPAITTEDVTATAGSKVTLKATVTGPADMLNNGKIVFKINGKSVKDENGKVIYAKIVNGEVSVEYTIPEYFKAKDYTITATYISSNYDRIEDSKTLTIN
ncbi:MAG: hypothetical protein E7Z86_07050 [Methanosphaera stadtmanae]|jgi:hypothetical protein|nr:hypothetical protein [Methanosphaera stadtmanae]